MNDNEVSQTTRKPAWRTPLLLVIAVVMVLTMVRLGFWQLDRASQNQAIFDAMLARSEQTPLAQLPEIESDLDGLRYQKVKITGRYKPNSTFFVDNKVFDGVVGFWVGSIFVPDETVNIEANGRSVAVLRGWVAKKADYSAIAEQGLPKESVLISARLNLPPPQPPLWDDSYPVSDGSVWQYLPIEQLSQTLDTPLYPLVLELDEREAGHNGLVQNWSKLSREAAAKNEAYALQWFAMAVAFTIACLIVLLRRRA